MCCCFIPSPMETKRSCLFVCDVPNAFRECASQKLLIISQIYSYWKCMKTVFCKQGPLFLRLSPSSLGLLTKLMTETLQQHIAISRSIWGAQIALNIPKIQSLSFFLWFGFPSVSLSFALFSSHLTSPFLSPGPHLLFPLSIFFSRLCKSKNEIKPTDDPVPTSLCPVVYFSLSC